MVWYNPTTWRMDPKWPVLSGLPTIQFRVLFLCLMDGFTLWWFWHTTETHLHASIRAMETGKVFAPGEALVLGVMGAWLTFLAGAHGFAYAGYRTKRNTSWDGNVEEDRGGDVDAQDRPMVNPASVRASNEAKMQGSGTTANAPAIAVPAAIVPASEVEPEPAPAPPVVPPVVPPPAPRPAPVPLPVPEPAPPPANVEASGGGTPAPPEGSSAGDGFEEGADAGDADAPDALEITAEHERPAGKAAPLPLASPPKPGAGSGFTAAPDRGRPGRPESPTSLRSAPRPGFPTEADE